MPKLVDMKIDKAAREAKYAKAETVAMDAPSYPWGLSINLDEESIEKLGMEELPTVDTYVMVTARCCVSSVSSNETANGKDRRVSLQIEKMAVSAAPAEKSA